MNLLTLQPEEAPLRSVVRLATSYWSDTRGAYQRRELRYLRRLSSGEHLLELELSGIGDPGAVLQSIVNLAASPDGLYTLTTCNEQRDWGTGCIDEYDLKLVPYTPPA